MASRTMLVARAAISGKTRFRLSQSIQGSARAPVGDPAVATRFHVTNIADSVPSARSPSSYIQPVMEEWVGTHTLDDPKGPGDDSMDSLSNSDPGLDGALLMTRQHPRCHC